MGENLAAADRQAVRTPMQWSDEPGGGFSTADPSRFPNPVTEGEYGPLAVNVARQRRDEGSLLNWFERLIRRRRETPELGLGEWCCVPSEPASVLVHRCTWEGSTVVALHNFSAEPCRVSVALEGLPDAVGADDLLDGAPEVGIEDATLDVTLDGYGYRWYRIRREGRRITP